MVPVQNRPLKKIRIVAKLAGAPLLHHVDEGGVDFKLKCFQPFDVLGLFRLERIECHLVAARRIDTPLHTDLLQQFGKAERGRNDADGANDGGGSAMISSPASAIMVAAGGRHIFHEDENLLSMFHGKIADAAIDQARLHRRAARRIDGYGNRRGMLVGKGLFQNTGRRCERKRGPQGCAAGHDCAMQAHDGDFRFHGAKTAGNKAFQQTGQGELQT